METLHLLDAKNIDILFMVNDEIEEHERLVKGNLAFGRFRPNAVDDVALQPKQLGKNGDDNRCLSLLGESKNNPAGFMEHAGFWIFCRWILAGFRILEPVPPESRSQNQES